MNKSMNLRRLLAVMALGLALSGPVGAARGAHYPHEQKTAIFDNDFFAAGEEVVVGRIKQPFFPQSR